MDAPVRNDPIEEDSLQVIMTDGAAFAEVLLRQVEDRLGQRHDCAGEPKERRGRREGDVGKVEVEDVHEILHDVEKSYGGSVEM